MSSHVQTCLVREEDITQGLIAATHAIQNSLFSLSRSFVSLSHPFSFQWAKTRLPVLFFCHPV